MSKPESIKVEPWADFPRQPYSIFSDDFVHDKFGTIKLNAKGEKSSASIKVSASSQKDSLTLSDEIKLWWNIKENRSIFTQIKSSDYLKVHLDNGITSKWGVNWNLYGSVNVSKSLNNLSVRLGAHSLSAKLNSDNRFKFDYSADGQLPSVTWYNRTLYNRDNFVFGSLTAVGISRQIIAKNNFFIGYRHKDKHNFFLRAENDGYRK
jgi:hypothetical protein